MDYKNIDWNQAVQNTLADYEKAKTVRTSTERKEVDLSKYFTLALPEKVNSGERIFRVLPLDQNGKWYEIGKFHNLKIGKNWNKLYDPAQDGEESPLNDMYKIYINGDAEDKKIANSYKSREFYIVKGIERGKEHEGVKFWRFPKVNDGSGIMDKMIPMMNRLNDKNPGSGAFYRPDAQGRDIVISVVRDTVKNYTKVSQIMFDDPAELSKDAEQATTWLTNEMTWKDIWKKKSIDFLRIVAQGGEPVWNSEQKGFVAKVDDMGASAYNTPVPPSQSGYPTPVANTEADNSAEPVTLNVDDLPF
jgi:hypothetical protein